MKRFNIRFYNKDKCVVKYDNCLDYQFSNGYFILTFTGNAQVFLKADFDKVETESVVSDTDIDELKEPLSQEQQTDTAIAKRKIIVADGKIILKDLETLRKKWSEENKELNQSRSSYSYGEKIMEISTRAQCCIDLSNLILDWKKRNIL